ncbi:IclR family transcriptional regulator [Rhodococcus pseudokoreensis]|uniref:IclR family transcriptional regulator n=1 Tax=Rhodococcus pseudokoreensis TaxID=2811421 RepID=A0A974ZXA0_9NOCA|nr:IclR family transcriptional regulator [Rhodococcus pseudokoreensis]QSE93760.1 IclR family transcriptional regulator [Rhodococcus pseudokoreensis]
MTTSGSGSEGARKESARRALELLFAFTEDRPVASVRQLADAIGVPVPTVHRYVALLRDMGLVEESARGQYHLTARVTGLYRAFRQVTSIVDIAEPFMRELAEQIEETVLLIRLVNGVPACIHRIEAPRLFRMSIEVGQHLPPLRGASARLLLGDLPSAERERYVDRALASNALPPLNGKDEFLREAQQEASRGWTVSSEEIGEGFWTAAAAIKQHGRTIATVSTPCAGFLLDDEKRSIIVEMIQKTASQISGSLADVS